MIDIGTDLTATEVKIINAWFARTGEGRSLARLAEQGRHPKVLAMIN